MDTVSNDVFFSALTQFAHDANAGAAIVAAVAAVVERDDFNRRFVISDASQNNLRWFASQKEDVQIQIMALAHGVKKHYAKTEGKQLKARPAVMNLNYLKIAVYVFRFLKKKSSIVKDIVANTQLRTRAAYKAVVRIHWQLINEMRENAKTKPWATISKALQAITSTRIPPSVLSSIHKEVCTELMDEQTKPHVMSHFERECISNEAKAAYVKAGYENIGTCDDAMSQ